MKSGFVALIGRPNAGKSTLMNEILERKVAIMSDKPQTTRNRITGVYTKDDKQIIYIDTPGIHKPRHKLGEYMVNIAENTLKDVDIIYYMVDVTREIKAEESHIIEKLKGVKTPIFLILNKIDLVPKAKILEIIDFWQKKVNFTEIFPISALKRENVDYLVEKTEGYLQEGPFYYPEDAVTDQPERVIISELIREKILHATREEIPHSVAVVIEEMKPRKKNLIYISANIFVERKSQKMIIIGKNGALLKKIGQDARREIEFLVGNKVYLELWVKVKEDWRNKNTLLSNFGYDKRDL